MMTAAAPPQGVVAMLIGYCQAYALINEMAKSELHDTLDCSRDGERCVYGYWRAPDENADRASRE